MNTVKKQQVKEKNNQDQGFTLIDLAIGLLVLSVMIVPLMQLYNIYQQQKTQDELQNLFNAKLNHAFIQYFYSNTADRLPCPADPTLPRTDTAYGVGDCASPNVVGFDDVTNDTYVGMIPFKDLNIPEEYIYDPWHNKITYVTPVERTSPIASPINIFFVARDPVDNSCEPDVLATNTMTANHFALISHGKNGRGAYNASGTLTAPCLTAASATAESPNCEYRLGKDFKSHECRRNDHTDIREFDDYVMGYNISIDSDWVRSSATSNGISNSGRYIGIHTPSLADVTDALTVNGNILLQNNSTDPTRNGELHVNRICDLNASNDESAAFCMHANLIGGDEDAMECGTAASVQPDAYVSGAAARGFRNNRIDCEPEIQGLSGSCTVNNPASGISSTGVLICP